VRNADPDEEIGNGKLQGTIDMGNIGSEHLQYNLCIWKIRGTKERISYAT